MLFGLYTKKEIDRRIKETQEEIVQKVWSKAIKTVIEEHGNCEHEWVDWEKEKSQTNLYTSNWETVSLIQKCKKCNLATRL